MKRIFLVLIYATSIVFLKAATIIPAPKIWYDDKIVLDWTLDRTRFSIAFDSTSFHIPVFARALSLIKDLPLNLVGYDKDVRIVVKHRGQNPTYDTEMANIIADSLLDKEEGYLLHLSNREIIIYGFDPAGILYAVQSLRQLICGWVREGEITQQTIIDYPTFLFRGVMDDISRGPLSSMYFIKEQIRRLSLLKINVFTFYIEHVLKTKKHYAYAPKEAMTLEEVEELSTYADSFNIQLMGSFQSLGHFKNILKHPEYEHLGVSERMLKPADDEAQEFLKEVYDELTPTFHHDIFNINGDEAYDLNRGKALQALADSIGKGQIFMNHILPLLHHIKHLRKTPGLWGDVLLHYPTIIDQLPPQTTVFTWNYNIQEDYDDFIIPFVSRHVKCIVAPGVVNSNRLWPDLLEARQNIAGFTYDGWRLGAAGVLTTVWDDGGRHFFNCDWYGVALGAAHSWNPEKKETPHFDRDFYQVFYQGHGDHWSSFLEALRSLQGTTKLSNLDNSILSYTINLDDDAVYLDTSETSEILTGIRVANTALKAIEAAVKEDAKTIFKIADFEFWKFKMEELEMAVKTPLILLDLAQQLKDTIAFKSEARSELISRVSKQQLDRWTTLKEAFKELWYSENRGYWYEEAQLIYTQRISFWYGVLSNAADTTFSLPLLHTTTDKFFTYWLATGAFKAESNWHIDSNYLIATSSEEALKPGAIDFYKLPDGTYHSWRKIIGSHPNLMQIDSFYSTAERRLIYVSCQIIADQSDQVRYTLQYPGKFKLFINGEEPQDFTQSGNTISGQITLKSGRNYLLIKLLEPEQRANSFSFHLPGQNVERNKYRYYLKN